jgi:CRISPR/Cas system CSM-associated protein Csm3 (group 7 of RAMP superfamily)
MNPYDFVRIDWTRSPERRTPTWHHRLHSWSGRELYSGHLNVDVYVETAFFIGGARVTSGDPKKPTPFIQNGKGEYIIPGSSLKGLLRCLVETLANGCMTIFDGDYERRKVDYNRKVPATFQRCSTNTDLCIACRIFGMLGGRDGRGGTFLGKTNIGDAVVYPDKIYLHDPIYTKLLMEPRPHHRSFYLDESERYIAGRKYYFHHSPDTPLEVETKLLYNRNGYASNYYIQPLDYETAFHFRIDFTNLESDEFAALLFAIVLEDSMRHQLGYGKPLGLGTVALWPTSLTLIDYTARYTRPSKDRGRKTIEGNDVWQFIYEQTDTFNDTHLMNRAMQDLRRIWQWPPDAEVEYYYPSKRDWFDTNESIGKRIADTKYVPR